MKWLWIILGAIAAAIALIAIIGAMLPVKHKASRRALYRQPPESIWTAITGPQDWRPVQDPPITFEVVESDAPRRLITRIADKNLPFGGTWTYEIERLPDGSALRVIENGEVYNPIFRFFSRFVFGHTKTMEDTMKALAKKFGEAARIED